MNNYYEVINNGDNKVMGVSEAPKEYNMKELSSKISCKNMSLLSKKYTDNQRLLFDANINMELCRSHQYYFDNLDDIKGRENGLLSGMSIGKKSCIYKKPFYNQGDWTFQYGISDTFKNQLFSENSENSANSANSENSSQLFNYQSKAKTAKNFKKECPTDINFKSLGECDRGPFSTYVSTFTNDHDNCV